MTAANRAEKKQASITQQHASNREKVKNVVSRLHVDGGRESGEAERQTRREMEVTRYLLAIFGRVQPPLIRASITSGN